MKTEEIIGNYLIENNLTLSTVESCTGGLLSSKLTDISGSSAYITLNLITYANEAKNKMLNVGWDILNSVGAVSEECSQAMAKGLYKLTGSDICISTTGIAGPSGGTIDKPVGLMYSTIYFGKKDEINSFKIIVPSDTDRIQIKELFVSKVLENLIELLNRPKS